MCVYLGCLYRYCLQVCVGVCVGGTCGQRQCVGECVCVGGGGRYRQSVWEGVERGDVDRVCSGEGMSGGRGGDLWAV